MTYYFLKVYFYFLIYSLTIAFPQINFFLTNHFNHDQNHVIFEYNCVQIPAPKIIKQQYSAIVLPPLQDFQETISLCLTESVSKWHIPPNTTDQKFTFDDLRRQNVTSEQLYQWSASIDLIEDYAEYLTLNQSSLSNHVFYNCTPPRFGPQCQYEFLHLPSENLTLNEIILGFYRMEYKPKSLTCYKHLECDRGSKSLCLDWKEIADGYVDCSNDQVDEKFYWQLENNECGQDEYRCQNGQCVSKQSNYVPNKFSCFHWLGYAYYKMFSEIVANPPMLYVDDAVCPYRNGRIPFGNSCDLQRDDLLHQSMLNDKPNTLSNICHFTFYCRFYGKKIFSGMCEDICSYHGRCASIVDEVCPKLIMTPAAPIAYGHIHLGYLRQSNDSLYSEVGKPQYICYNEKFCESFRSNAPLILVNNKTCIRAEDASVSFFRQEIGLNTLKTHIASIHKLFGLCTPIPFDDINNFNNSSQYRCQNSSKVISIHRLCDKIFDCFYNDDEQCQLVNGNCTPIESNVFFKCYFDNKCISRSRLGDGNCDCLYNARDICEDELDTLCDATNLNECKDQYKQSYISNHISFPTICDGFLELLPIFFNGTNHTDESECQYWKCNNTYTRCDGFWNCFDGADEIGCDEHPLINCSLNQHICIKPRTFEFMCLPLEKANDGHIDCLGATDEPKQCRSTSYTQYSPNFYCDSINNAHCVYTYSLCSQRSKCNIENENLLCDILNGTAMANYCPYAKNSTFSYLIRYLCSRPLDYTKAQLKYFSIGESANQEPTEEKRSVIKQTFSYDFECHRGYPLRLRLGYNHSLNDIICLCPFSYYGPYCQYQNQRVSLTLQFQTFSDSVRTLFSLVILLTDNTTQRTIHSSKQITYISIKHCQIRFNFQLTYSTRPKHPNKTYYVHIDVYEKSTFGYRGSFYIPLNFPFLPVHHVVSNLNIPRNNQSLILNLAKDQLCINGQLVKYADNSNILTFCHCKEGWSGKDCSISSKCSCSPDSFCAGLQANNRSICICRPNQWGSRCYLRNTVCQLNGTSPCLNNGHCILINDHMISEEKFFCICSKGFSGDRCEIEDAKIIVSFDQNITLSEVMLIHFIEVNKKGLVRNGSTFQSIPLYQNNVTIRWSRSFHIVFTELTNKTYYLIDVQKDYNRSRVIRKQITSSDRCAHLSEYFNETILDYHLIRRIKYYHLPCQQSISCFYDRDYFCLCNDFGLERVANCFEFDSTISQNCYKLSNCQNGGQCLQDDARCPQTSRCVCRECYYGSLCQFSSSLFDISLDGIIGVHIQPNLSIHLQPLIIQITLTSIIVLAMIGFINGILSFMAFKSKETRQVGCGYYLLGSTITTLLTSMMLLLKFMILLFAQMSMISNRTFLNIHCYSMDYLLQICPNMDRWLNGCVAMERAFNIIKGATFDKDKSKKAAKCVTSTVFLMTIIATIHDPIHRNLVDDESNDEQKRIWCIVSYSSELLHFNQFIHMFHFFVPFLLNIISSLIIVILSTKRRRTARSEKSYYQTLYEEIQQHRHLLIAPFVLVILSLPRLIISFVGGCMELNRNPWLYLIGYLISFIPPMLTFVIFVLPSKLYKDEFRKTVKKYRQRIRGQMCCLRH